MWIVESGEASDAWILRPSRHKNHAAGIDVEVQSFVAHVTAEVSSQWRPMCLCVKDGAMCSRHRYPRMMPASSKLLMVSMP
eukprot:8373623-Ditylum_brightwellii.AAC.1